MKTTTKNSAATFSSLLFATSLSHAATIVDDFNDGNHDGWVRYDPIGLITSGSVASTYGFPNGDSYRIQATSSPDPSIFGPSRAGAFRNDATFSDFRVEVDLLNWGLTDDQQMSLFARGGNIGPGTSNGYVLSYFSLPSEGSGALQISRIDGETPQAVNFFGVPNVTDITLDPVNDYRLVFTGSRANFTGEVFDLTDLMNPLATVTGFDETYADGLVGLLSATATPNPGDPFQNNGTDVTFDNFSAVPEPSGALLAIVGSLGFLLRRRRA